MGKVRCSNCGVVPPGGTDGKIPLSWSQWSCHHCQDMCCRAICNLEHRCKHRKHCAKLDKSLKEIEEMSETGTPRSFTEKVSSYVKEETETDPNHISNKYARNDETASNYDYDSYVPPSRPECTICCLPMPLSTGEWKYQGCCGATICMGCFFAYAMEGRRNGKKLEEAIKCMYCRQGVEWEKDPLVCLNRRIEKYKDMYAIRTLADAYRKGLFGIKVDHKRAIELYEQAIESGDPAAASNLADYYRRGVLVAQDMDRALGYSKKAAELGNPASRCNLAVREGHRGNLQAGSYHYRIAAAAGYEEALKGVKAMYMARVITKEEFTKSLRECQDAKSAMNSLQREDARKFNAGVLPSRYQEVLSTTTSSVHKKKWK